MFLMWLLLGCNQDDTTAIDQQASRLIVTQNQKAFDQNQSNLNNGIIKSDPFGISSVTVVDQTLQVVVTYAGGCEVHEFELIWPEAITLIYPPDFGVILNHDSNRDPCEAFFVEILTFDLQSNPLGLSDEEIRDMRITVVNGSNPEEEVSNHH